MGLKIRSEKDLGSGLLYLLLGSVGLAIALDYSFGTAGRMGPGYFPMVISGLLVSLGVVTLVRSLLVEGTPITAVNWKGLVLVTLAVCLFGVLLMGAGLPVALAVLILVSARASEKFALGAKAVAAMIGLVLFCSLVFVKGLGVPMPLFGAWFSSIVAP
ncbi:tripartite tricarboxylate transporter TctB family protein [Agrobacterium leguminum]|uniref:tripartite tricarboxylate transporter TctB family protein n=1 Tax=Agrobacterium leguminum TaxID=2792015 RepID=UPI00272DC626|nr:tripartite tricarboxylate transporter TctB family protein [Agrobacterium leguminum]WLD99911.1 tripartite tricarboxylate transporter TctB family protein [Agrobacterium leguminum]